MTIRSFALTLIPVLALGMPSSLHARTDEAAEEVLRHGTRWEYVDASTYLTEPDDINAWYGILYDLRQDFDYICGDTFCEGEYTNIQSLRYRCSVERTTGVIGRCVWIFAASDEQVSLSTGRIIVDFQGWRCRSPIPRGATIHDFLLALSGPSPLYAPLPGTDQSLYDGLGTCL